MGRVDEPMDSVCVAIAVAVVASAVASWIWVKRRAKRYSPEGALGQAQRPFGEVPLGEPLDAGPLMRSGLDVTRGVRLLRVPAGGRLVAKGRVQTTGLTTDFSFLLFAKPPR